MTHGDDSTNKRTGQAFSSSTSIGLLHRARSNSVSAWSRLVDTYSPLVYECCRRKGLQPVDAQDVVQDVLLGVASGLAKFRREDAGQSFRAWLRTITQRRIADFYRRAEKDGVVVYGGTTGRRRFAELADSDGDASETHSATAASRSGERSAALDAARASVSDRNWRIFLRLVVDERTTEEVAKEFSTTPNAVRLVKSRVKRLLASESFRSPVASYERSP